MTANILIVNPNTTTQVTDAYLACARALAPPDVSFTGVTGQFGAQIVSTEAENIIAGHSALDLVATHADGFDAVILAISFDTALQAVRDLLDVPVIGITEAALRAAEATTDRIGAIVFGEVSRPLYESLFQSYGASLTGVEVVEFVSAADYLAPGAKDAAVADACRRLSNQGAEAVVICGAAVVGMAERLRPQLENPIYDGAEAVPACLKAMKDAPVHGPTPRPIAETVGLSPALTNLLKKGR